MMQLTVQQLTKESSSKRITAEEAVAIDEVTILLTELLVSLDFIWCCRVNNGKLSSTMMKEP
jgi:hypothetical protein